MPERVFSFGTLQFESVQRALYGRTVPTAPDAIRGYRVAEVRITDPAVIAASGLDVHPALVPADGDDEVPGVVLDLSEAELAATDEYERVAYRRAALPLVSGGRAWVYLLRDV